MAKKRMTKEEIIKRNRRIRRKLIGAVFLVFALIGVAAVLTLAVQGVIRSMDDTNIRAAYEETYYTLVALDPVPFSISESPPDDLLLEAAIWATVRGENLDKYSRNEDGALLLPAVDVEKYAAAMYSSSYVIEHRTFTDVDLEFVYDITTKLYTIPLTSLINLYEPNIISMKTSGGTRVLTVQYLSAADSDVYAGSAATQTVVKTMEYVLVREDGEYRLSAVRRLEDDK